MKHLDGEQLLRFADGELAASEIPAIREHLEACWQCRMELEEFQKTINECARYRKNVLQTHLPSPPAPWCDLSRRFTEADATLRRPSILPPWRAAFSGIFPISRKWAAGGLLLGVAVVAATLRIRTDQPQIQLNPSRTGQRQISEHTEFPKQDIPAAPALSAPTGPITPSDGVPQATVPAATAADELRVFVALHLVGADLGEPVQVTRSEGRIHVAGMGIDPSRQSRILAALSAIPNLDIRFNEPASGTTLAADFNPAGSPGASAAGFQDQILRQLGSRAAFETFSNQILERSESAMARAHALRRLSQRFPVEVEQGLNADERQLLLDLRRQHLSMLDQEFAEIRRAAQTALPSTTIPAAPQPRPASWQAAAEELFQSARQMERSLAVSLGASSGDITADRLFTTFAQLKGSIDANRRLTASE